jgi:fructokinase
MFVNSNGHKVYALGETVLDLVTEPISLGSGFNMKAVPGGSVLNASVSLGKMGIDVNLVSEFGADKAGDAIEGFLESNGVKTDFCIRHPKNKTSIALAFLDDNKNASYSFYHDSPEHMQPHETPAFSTNDVLLFGSYYAVKPSRRKFVLDIVHKALEAKSLIYYDLNIRKAHAGEQELLMTSFLENMKATTIVKGSDEDFRNLFGITEVEEVYAKVSTYCQNLLITCGSQPVHIFTPSYHKIFPVQTIKPVSTIGAGDNFNAGFIYGLVTSGISTGNLAEIPSTIIDRVVACGLAFASETCCSADNYITKKFEPDFWKRYI